MKTENIDFLIYSFVSQYFEENIDLDIQNVDYHFYLEQLSMSKSMGKIERIHRQAVTDIETFYKESGNDENNLVLKKNMNVVIKSYHDLIYKFHDKRMKKEFDVISKNEDLEEAIIKIKTHPDLSIFYNTCKEEIKQVLRV